MSDLPPGWVSLERITPREVSDVFHALRKIGNRAVHDGEGTFPDALSALKFAWCLVPSSMASNPISSPHHSFNRKRLRLRVRARPPSA
nr:DUF4145 domain-containing protein [Bradyrhizobium genosp. SA-3]